MLYVNSGRMIFLPLLAVVASGCNGMVVEDANQTPHVEEHHKNQGKPTIEFDNDGGVDNDSAGGDNDGDGAAHPVGVGHGGGGDDNGDAADAPVENIEADYVAPVIAAQAAAANEKVEDFRQLKLRIQDLIKVPIDQVQRKSNKSFQYFRVGNFALRLYEKFAERENGHQGKNGHLWLKNDKNVRYYTSRYPILHFEDDYTGGGGWKKNLSPGENLWHRWIQEKMTDLEVFNGITNLHTLTGKEPPEIINFLARELYMIHTVKSQNKMLNNNNALRGQQLGVLDAAVEENVESPTMVRKIALSAWKLRNHYYEKENLVIDVKRTRDALEELVLFFVEWENRENPQARVNPRTFAQDILRDDDFSWVFKKISFVYDGTRRLPLQFRNRLKPVQKTGELIGLALRGIFDDDEAKFILRKNRIELTEKNILDHQMHIAKDMITQELRIQLELCDVGIFLGFIQKLSHGIHRKVDSLDFDMDAYFNEIYQKVSLASYTSLDQNERGLFSDVMSNIFTEEADGLPLYNIDNFLAEKGLAGNQQAAFMKFYRSVEENWRQEFANLDEALVAGGDIQRKYIHLMKNLHLRIAFDDRDLGMFLNLKNYPNLLENEQLKQMIRNEPDFANVRARIQGRENLRMRLEE